MRAEEDAGADEVEGRDGAGEAEAEVGDDADPDADVEAARTGEGE